MKRRYPHLHKLSEEDLAMIAGLVKERERLKDELSRLSNAELAKKFDVSQRTMQDATCRMR